MTDPLMQEREDALLERDEALTALCEGWCSRGRGVGGRDGRSAAGAEEMTPEVESRFWPKTERGQNGCIIWIGALSDGYGQLGVDGKRRYAHRLAYEHFIGPVPVGLELDHKCRVRACVNPWHLEPVTAKENVLRGEGLCGVNARKTHCVHGHEFTPANTYSSPTWPGRRECRTCKRRLGRAWDRQHRRVASPRGGETA